MSSVCNRIYSAFILLEKEGYHLENWQDNREVTILYIVYKCINLLYIKKT